VYRKAWKEKQETGPLFNLKEKIIAIALLILAVISIIMLLSGIQVVENATHWIELQVEQMD